MNPDFKKLIEILEADLKKDPSYLKLTLENIFSFRKIGNKTHGDLAEVGLSEFINAHIPNWKSQHVGKDLFRAKSNEEDIKITTPENQTLPVSIKAYGHGALQLSTNKEGTLFASLEENLKSQSSEDTQIISTVLTNEAFNSFSKINILPLIYDEDTNQCRIMVFDWDKAKKSVTKIEYLGSAGRRVHPIYEFKDKDDNYIFEVRYGTKKANPLQRGLWTHTEWAENYFTLVTNWIAYNTNDNLIHLVSTLLIQNRDYHTELLDLVKARQLPTL